MRRQPWIRRLIPPLLAVAGLSAGFGCGVVNPQLLGVVGGNTAATVTGTQGNVVILVVNTTTVTTGANLRITKANGGVIELNVGVAANDHEAIVQGCDVDTVEVVQASFAGANGANLIPAAISPIRMGQILQCGGVISIELVGTAPNIVVNVQVLG